MFLTIVSILNIGFLGEQHQLLPIEEQLKQKYSQYQLKTEKFNDDDSTLPKKLDDTFIADNKNILLISGKKGCTLVERKDIQELIQRKKVFVIWISHQHPDELIMQEKWFNRVALPNYIIDAYPILQATFKDRLLPLLAVPNMIKEGDLQPALEKWNKEFPSEVIAIAAEDTRAPVGIFLGGDAPKRDNTHLYWDEKEAFEQGKAFGVLARQEKKFLWVTNGPRTGKFYPESSNPKTPIIRQFRGSEWVSYGDLVKEHTEAELLAGQEKQFKESTAHAIKSPLDPVSASFIKGLESSGLIAGKDFRFIDFKMGKSAFNAILALIKTKKAEAFYSAESISNASIGYFIYNTYTFRVGNMNTEHEKGLASFTELGVVSEFNPKTLQRGAIDPTKKRLRMIEGSQDAASIADSAKEFMVGADAKHAKEGAAIGNTIVSAVAPAMVNQFTAAASINKPATATVPVITATAVVSVPPQF